MRRAIAAEAARHLASRATAWAGGGAIIPEERRPSDPEIEEHNRLFELMSWMFFFSDHEHLLLTILMWLNRARRMGCMEYTAMPASALGFALDTAGAHRAASAYHRQAMGAAERSGRLPTIGFATNLMGIHLFHTGGWAEADRCLERAREHAWHAGDLYTWCSATVIRCELLCELGRLEEVLADADAMIALGREAAFGPATRWSGTVRGSALRRLGSFQEARERLEEAMRLSAEASDHVNLVVTCGELGTCLQSMGRLDEAMTVLREGCGAAVAKARGHTTVSLLLGLASASLMAAERGRAPWREAERACRGALRAGRRFRLGLVPALRLRGTLEWLGGRRGSAERWWGQGACEAERVGARYEGALCLLEAGTRLGDARRREAALAMLAAMGARHGAGSERRGNA